MALRRMPIDNQKTESVPKDELPDGAGLIAIDDMDSDADGATVNGLNGGNGWGGPYVVR